MKKIICISVIISMLLLASNIYADCIGNSTHWCVQHSISGNSVGEGDTWCCTPVGDGSAYSCSNGNRWELNTEISGCILNEVSVY